MIFINAKDFSTFYLNKTTQIHKHHIRKRFRVPEGGILGFGPSAENKPRAGVMKISGDDKTLERLDSHVPVHNLAQERNVGCINYGLTITGKFIVL